jgi:hypothetical protein
MMRLEDDVFPGRMPRRIAVMTIRQQRTLACQICALAAIAFHRHQLEVPVLIRHIRDEQLQSVRPIHARANVLDEKLRRADFSDLTAAGNARTNQQQTYHSQSHKVSPDVSLDEAIAVP